VAGNGDDARLGEAEDQQRKSDLIGHIEHDNVAAPQADPLGMARHVVDELAKLPIGDSRVLRTRNAYRGRIRLKPALGEDRVDYVHGAMLRRERLRLDRASFNPGYLPMALIAASQARAILS
jgi:hypothetical protein